MSEGNLLPVEFYSKINRSRAKSTSEFLTRIATESDLHLHYSTNRINAILGLETGNEYLDMMDTFFSLEAEG